MRRHLPNTLHHTDCTRRTTAGGRNRYARIGRGIANAPGAGQMNSSRRRCVTDLSLDGSAPVFSIVWFTRGSIDASAAQSGAAEFGRRSHATPTARPFSRLAKCGAPFGGGRFRRAVVYGGASVFSNRRTAAPIYGSVPHLRRTPIVPAANDHTPSGTGMTGTNPENPVPETMLRPMNPDFTTVLTASQNANGCAGRIVSRGRNTHAAARWPRRIRGASEEPNHLAPHEDRPSATEASPSNDRMRLSSIFHRIVAYDDTQSLNLEVTPFISGVSSATSCFEFEDKKNGRIGRPSMHVGTHVGPMPFSGAVLSCLSHTTASNAASPSGDRMDRRTPAKPSFGMEPTWGQVHCQDRGECRGQRHRGRFLLLAVVRRTAAGEWPGIHRRSRRVSHRPFRSRSPFFPNRVCHRSKQGRSKFYLGFNYF